MARLLCTALEVAGHSVERACGFSSFDALADGWRQERLAALGERLATALSGRYRRRPASLRPNLWFTYHLYHKAPDWLGPTVTRALGIPYAVAEASFASKQEFGAWATGHIASKEAIAAADLVLGLNSADTEGIRPLLVEPGRLLPLKPFIDSMPYAKAVSTQGEHRRTLALAYGFDASTPLLLSVAMMRPGDKLASYRLLGQALAMLTSQPWQLVVVGDGPALPEVRKALALLGSRVTWLGRLEGVALAQVYAAADLYVWPAIGEAYGMAFLEAQAAGLPVVAGRNAGVADVVAHGETGHLVPVGDAVAFAEAIAELLANSDRRWTMHRRASVRIRRDHDLVTAARILSDSLTRLVDAAEAPR